MKIIYEYDEKGRELSIWLKSNHPNFWSKLINFEIISENVSEHDIEQMVKFKIVSDSVFTELTRTLLPVYRAKDLVELVHVRHSIRKTCRIELGLPV